MANRRTYTFRHDCKWRNAKKGDFSIVFAAVYPDGVRAAWTTPLLTRPIVRGFFSTAKRITVEPMTETLWLDGERFQAEKDADTGLWYVFAGEYRRLLSPEVIVKKTYRYMGV